MKILVVLVLIGLPAFGLCQNIGINEDGSNPDPSAILDIKSDDKGMLVPRMSSAQRAAIVSPANGLLVYDTDTDSFWFSNGSTWLHLINNSSSQADWYEEGTTQAADTITDDIYRLGNLGIGHTSANYPLDILSSASPVARIRSTNTGSYGSSVLRLEHSLYPSSPSNSYNNRYGLSLSASGNLTLNGSTSTSRFTGSSNQINLSSNDGYNNYIAGSSNYISGFCSNSIPITYEGLYNSISPTRFSSDISEGYFRGVHNNIVGFGRGTEIGIENNLSGDYIETKHGVYNVISNYNPPNSSAKQYDGVFNSMDNLYGDVTASGVLNELQADHQLATIHGTKNSISSSLGTAYGEHTRVHSEFGSAYGNYIFLDSYAGNTGRMYGIYDSLKYVAGNTNLSYGLYVVNENLSTGYAAYFRGRISIGTSVSDQYLLPASRGTIGQIMQSDASGVVSWTDLEPLVDDADADPNNEIQSISLADSLLSISDGNTLNLVNSGHWLRNGSDIYNYNSDGVGIGNASPNQLLHVGTTTGDGIGIGNAEYILDGGGFVLSCNGGLRPAFDNLDDLGSSSLRWDDVYATSGVVNTSDRRDKSNIAPIEYGLDHVLSMNPVSYSWKDNPEKGIKLGLIAQELQTLVPEVVKSHDVEYNESDRSNKKTIESERLGVYYSDLIPVLIKAIQEQNEIIESLKFKIEKLEE